MDTQTNPHREDDRHTDPLQVHGPASDAPYGSPTSHLEPAEPLSLDRDHDLSRIGFWSLSLGVMGFFVGITFLLAGGILPGTLVAALALICTLFGALALAVVAHHAG